MGFPERLAKLRMEFNMTQKELADKIGVSRAAIGMYEIGRRDPDTDTIIKLTKIFGVSADYLMGISDIRNPYNNLNTSSKNINTIEEPPLDEEYFTIEDLKAFIKERRKKKNKD
ncbi:MAG: helix-turn-helix transcriptional regulator [Caldicoprobacterales bacterium]|nr:helix-turn-helix transcriptional regulator [Clostridiales bacterium]